MKKIKYFKIKTFLENINENQKNIFIIAHINYFNMFEILKLKSYCQSNNISLIKIKNKLLKKLFKNQLFHNLLVGPSCFMYLKKINDLNLFFSNNLIQKKILPLVVYWNNNFYDYNFFLNYYNACKLLDHTNAIHDFLKKIFTLLNLKLNINIINRNFIHNINLLKK